MNKFKNSSCWSCEAKLMYSVKNVISKKGYEPGKRKYNQESVSKSTSTIAFPNPMLQTACVRRISTNSWEVFIFLVAIKTSTDVAFIFFLVQYHRMPASSFEIPPTAARPEVITKITTTFFRLLRDVKFCQRWERQCSPAKGQASLSKYDTMDNNKPNPACQPDFHHSDQMFERHSRKDRMFILGPGFRDSRVAWLHVLGQNIMVMELCMRRLSSLDDHLEIEGGKGTRIRCKACLQ